MKKIISISLIAFLAVGFGYFLFKISPETADTSLNGTDIKPMSQPSEVGDKDHVLGNPQAKNTFLIYEDLQCPACANFNQQVTTRLTTELRDTRVVFRHFPLVQIHKNAVPAALALEAAGAQGKFWDFTNAAYEKQADWSNLADPNPYFEGLAKAIGVADIEKFRSDSQGQAAKDKVEANYRESLALDLQGTPTVYFNNQKLELGGLDSIKQQAEKLYR